LSKINVTSYLYPGCAGKSKLTVEDQVLMGQNTVARICEMDGTPSGSQPMEILVAPRVVSRIEKPVAGPPSMLDKVMGNLSGKIPESPPKIVLLSSLFIDGLLPKVQSSPVSHSGE
jgi:hypothetical protein